MDYSYFKLADYFGYKTELAANSITSLISLAKSDISLENILKVFSDYKINTDGEIIILEGKIQNTFFILESQLSTCCDKIKNGGNINIMEDLNEITYSVELDDFISDIIANLTHYYQVYYMEITNLQNYQLDKKINNMKEIYDLQGPLNTLINETNILLYSIRSVNEGLIQIVPTLPTSIITLLLSKAQADIKNVFFYLYNFTFIYR